MISRRLFLRLAGRAVTAASIGSFVSCDGEIFDTDGNRRALEEQQQEIESAADRDRLLVRPDAAPADAKAPAGLQPLGLGTDRDGLIYVPEGYGKMEKTPRALALHGAGGTARAGISPLLSLADETG